MNEAQFREKEKRKRKVKVSKLGVILEHEDAKSEESPENDLENNGLESHEQIIIDSEKVASERQDQEYMVEL